MKRSTEEILGRFIDVLETSGWTIAGECQTILDSVKVICPNKHTTKKTPRTAIHQNKIKCRECQKASIKARASAEFTARLESVGWKALESYAGGLMKVRVVCPNGHEQIKSPCQLKTFQACKECHS